MVSGLWSSVPRRTIVVDEQGRVLFQVEYLPFLSPLDLTPDRPCLFWVVPGGGVEPGETFEAAACRGPLEETGLVADRLGPCLLEEGVLLPRADHDMLLHMRCFLVNVPAAEISLNGLDAVERGAYRDHRWWTLAEFEVTTETVYPAHLPALLRTMAGRTRFTCD